MARKAASETRHMRAEFSTRLAEANLEEPRPKNALGLRRVPPPALLGSTRVGTTWSIDGAKLESSSVSSPPSGAVALGVKVLHESKGFLLFDAIVSEWPAGKVKPRHRAGGPVSFVTAGAR
jgi:hypothetical protein